jgi:exosome complex component CSL4
LSERRSGLFVIPGEKLGVIEEFTPGAGTYVKNGVIYSKIVGTALLDMLNKKVYVYPSTHPANVPRVGSIVLGQVTSVTNKLAVIRIFKIGRRRLSGFFTGALHISDVSRGYVETMYDVCKPGDIIRARVTSLLNLTYHLSTNDKNLGVVYAFCSNCGAMLEKRKQRLSCSKCGKTEKRKVAVDYGKGIR